MTFWVKLAVSVGFFEWMQTRQYLDDSPAPKLYFRSRKEVIRVRPDDLNVISDDVLSKASRFG
ncbi:hypothetical protein HMPREF0541_01258 [Lacticaseibacillus rhamnosus ATCC 21052]|nr:hypothetical protein HMPREF0541_01258 [Lacticaseibacillus rhamnosus ATCC 21052]